jgi:hypothetical protein
VTGQEWFRTRYASVYQIIVNNFGAPAETPEHNALQVHFLDLEFCRGLLRALDWRPICDGRTVMKEWRAAPLQKERERLGKETERIQEACRHNDASLAAPMANEPPTNFPWRLPSEGHRLYSARDASDDPRRETAEQRTARWIKEQTAERDSWLKGRTASEANLTQAQQRLEEIDAELAKPLPLPFIEIKRPTFEVNGWDIKFEATATVDTPAKLCEESATLPDRSPYARNSIDYRIPITTCWRTQYSSYYSITVRVELKTALGDDYPAVLRQMKANRGKGGYDRDVRFTATGATREQIKALFAASDFTIVGLAAVEAACQQLQRSSA